MLPDDERDTVETPIGFGGIAVCAYFLSLADTSSFFGHFR
jgi:hypothetical protein